MKKQYTLTWIRFVLLSLFTGFGFTAFAQTQTITTTGTFQTPDGITSLRVECWGGGGRGGTTVSSGNETGGGGGGAYARRNALTVTPRTNYNVQVGTGSTNTSPGGDTFFNNATTVMAKGGNSVANNNTNGATGGTAAASVGDVTRNGGAGANGSNGNNGGGGGSSAGPDNAGVTATNQNGATAPTGGGNGGNGSTNNGTAGTAGSIPGGGGGGVRSGNNGNVTGGAGARGQIIVTWTCSNVLTSAAGTDNQNVCLGSPITNITYTCSGAYGATFAGLPAGVTGTYTDGAIVISGTPTATGTFTYTVTPTGSCTSSVVTGRIVVNPIPTAVSAVASSSSVCLGTAVNLIASATSNSSTAVTLLSQNFNGATNNWTTINNSTGGTPANAAWTLRPDGYDNTNDVFDSNDNTQFYLSDSDAQGSGSTTATILRSPSFSTVGLSAATLTFFHYNRHFTGQVAVVEASTDGSNWATLAGPYTSTQGAANNFTQVTANMSAYLNQPTVFIRFKFDSPWGWYWAVDNVTVAGTLATVPDATYAWTSNPPGFTSNLKNPTNVTPAVTTTYTVTATNNFGCSATASTTVVVNNPVPVSVSIAASATTICAGTSVTFTATPTNGGTTPAYQWRVNGNPVGTNSATFTTTTLANNDVVSVVLTSSLTCVTGNPATSNSITMTVNPILNASVSIAASATTICAGTSVTFTATPTNGGTTPAYQWRVNGNPVGTNSATFTSSSLTNNDVVTVVMTSNAAPCLAGSPATSNSITMTVNPILNASVSIAASATTICAGTSVTFTATPTNGGTTPAYQWRVNGNPVGTNSATFTSSSLTNNDVVTVVMTSNAAPCLAGSPATSNSITMSVNPILNASVSIAASATTICAGTSVTFTATPTNGGTSPAYQWRVNGNPVGTNSATFTSSSLTNNDVVTVVMTSNATPCLTGSPATSNSISMTVTPQPTATIAPVSSVCYGYDASFVINGTAGATVAYTLNGGATQTGVLTGGTLTVSVSGAQASQTLVLQTITLGGCVDIPLSESATITVATTTWNGTAWSNGAPDATTAAFITGNLTVAANLQACRMFVSNNAVVTVNSGFNVSLFGALEVATGSTFTLNSNANLLQEDPAAVNVGNIVVRRTTNPLIRLDYILWGSPVASQNLFAFSPLTSVNPTIRFYGYNTTTNLYNNVSDYATHIMQTGRGYLIRLPFNHPTAPATWTGVFTGVPNNGTKTVTLNNVGPGQRFNLVSNPYPSTLDINTFFAENSSALESTLYFWRKTNNANSPTYCTWNMATETYVDNGEAFTENPNGVIQVGQGFFVEAKGNATSMAFNNTQRVANNANQMFRSTSIEKNRIWLNITRGVDFAQTVVGYFTDGSLDLDATDSKYFNDGNLGLMTQINGTNYIVNGRPVPFDAADVVPLTYKATTAGQHTIAIDRVDGLFTGGTQPIYIRDLSDGTYHNLNQGPFTFNTQPGTFSNRLELVYQNALSNENPTLEATGFEVVRNNTSITVQASQTLQKVTVFDLRGRIVMTMDAVNATTVTLPVNQPDQVFIVQVTTTDGKVGAKKTL